VARSKSSHKMMVWNFTTDRFEPFVWNPVKYGRRKQRPSLKRKSHSTKRG